MAYLIGTDEAGYGPNLGPLVISATAWQVPDDLAADDLYDKLRHVVDRRPTPDESDRIAIADSKLLYRAGKGLSCLETGALAALGATSVAPGDWHALWQSLVPEDYGQPWEQACCDGFNCRLPIAADPARANQLALSLETGCREVGVRLLAIRSHPVFPESFNQLVEQHGTKGAALSHLTFRLIARVLTALGKAPVSVVCDKHGGRNCYAALLQDRFPESFVEVIRESRPSSVYRWGPEGRRVRIELRANGETCLPVALASMFSKYLRELSMRAFNQFWAGHLPDLRPTAGYPVDARRFKRDIAAVQRDLGIDDRVLWRTR